MIGNQIAALIKKDFLLETSYRFAFFFALLATLGTICVYFFIDRLFGSSIAPHLEEFGVSYFSYVLVGIAFFNYIGSGISSFAGRIRQEQLQGTFEWLFATPLSTHAFLLGLGIWNCAIATLELMLYLAAGYWLGALRFSAVNIASAAIFFLLSTISFSCLGILSASFIVVLKRGNPVGWLINTLEGIIAGVYFPVAVMPKFLRDAAQFFPMTHAIRALELSLYRGYTVRQLQKEFWILFIFTLALMIISPRAFRYSLASCRKKGSLSHY